MNPVCAAFRTSAAVTLVSPIAAVDITPRTLTLATFVSDELQV